MSGKGAGNRARRRASYKRIRASLGRFNPDEDVPCHYCQVATVVVDLPPGGPFPVDQRTRDHVVPRSVGGRDKPWNIVIACRGCNEARRERGQRSCWCAFCLAAWETHRRLAVAS
jgi:5-methylcytosine-specific restriction endonuclease McrA